MSKGTRIKQKEGNPMSNVKMKNTTTSIIVNAVLLPAIFFFVGPMMMMFGWNAIAWEVNLPAFDYLQAFCICNGLHWFIKGFRK
jgi:hypothetical protein